MVMENVMPIATGLIIMEITIMICTGIIFGFLMGVNDERGNTKAVWVIIILSLIFTSGMIYNGLREHRIKYQEIKESFYWKQDKTNWTFERRNR